MLGHRTDFQGHPPPTSERGGREKAELNTVLEPLGLQNAQHWLDGSSSWKH